MILCLFFRHRLYLYCYQIESPFVKAIRKQHQAVGRGIKIAIIDTGLNTGHIEFKEEQIEGYDFFKSTNSVVDDIGHGTWIAGIIAAEDNHYGICGIAPSSMIIPLKVFDEQGNCQIEMVCEAISWCIHNNIDIINISLATQNDDQELHDSINKALKAGIVVIASYSNEKGANSSYPADYVGVIGVKSCDFDSIYIDNGVWYAPGQDILTTDKKGGFIKVSGNSIAAACVTGYIAVVMEECHDNNSFFDPKKYLYNRYIIPGWQILGGIHSCKVSQ